MNEEPVKKSRKPFKSLLSDQERQEIIEHIKHAQRRQREIDRHREKVLGKNWQKDY